MGDGGPARDRERPAGREAAPPGSSGGRWGGTSLQPEAHYSVSEFAALVGVAPSTLRRWDAEGRLRPRRTAGGQRRYTAAMLEQALAVAGRPQASVDSGQASVDSGQGLVDSGQPSADSGQPSAVTTRHPTPDTRHPTPTTALASRFVIAVANQKGGCGKTTTAVNLAAALAGRGWATLLLDLDPQFNATSAVGLEPSPPSMADLMARRLAGGMDPLVRPTSVPLLTICPSSLDLAQVEVQLASAIASEAILADALGGLRHPARMVIVDCPPSLGKLTLNALAAANAVIVPVSDPWALHGVRFLDESIATARRLLRNPGLRVLGYLHTFYDARTTLSREIAAVLRARFNGKVFDTCIPVNAKLRETSAAGQPIAVYRPGSLLAEYYDRLADEVLSRVW